MQNKLIMVIGIALSKVLQLLFSFFLSYRFDHGDLSTFVLILSLAAAMSSIASLGASPQIIRAGAYKEPNKHIQSIVGIVILISIIISLLLLSYILLTKNTFFIKDFNKLDYFICTLLITISFIFYSLLQSFLSFKLAYNILGIYTLYIYSLPFFVSIIQSYILYDARLTVITYCTLFFLVNCILLYRVLDQDISIVGSLKSALTEKGLLMKLINFFKVAAFGFISMIGLYLTIKYVNTNFNSQESAIFSVSFQFFQIGLFLPGVLGSIFVPILIKNNKEAIKQRMKNIYITISLLWLVACILIVYPLFYLYGFEFTYYSILTFLLLQLSVVLASSQAYYIQNYIASGDFSFITKTSIIWSSCLLITQNFLPSLVFNSALALLISYFISNFVFFLKSKKVNMDTLI